MTTRICLQVLGLGLILLVVSEAISQTPRRASNKPSRHDGTAKEEISVTVGIGDRYPDSKLTEVDKLVLPLVSKRPAPYRSGYHSHDLPAEAPYITAEAATAIEELKKMGPQIFPELVKHLGDDRYCYSIVVAAWINQNVGDAIVDILSGGHYMHSGYKARETPTGTVAYLSFKDYLRSRDREEWAKWASTKSRLAIQLDFIDWCLEKEKQRGFIDESQRKEILETYESARKSVIQEYPNDDPGAAAHQESTQRFAPRALGMEVPVLTHPDERDNYLGQLVAVRGVVSNSKLPQIIDVYVDTDELRGREAYAVGVLVKFVVKKVDPEAANDGPGPKYMLYTSLDGELAEARALPN